MNNPVNLIGSIIFIGLTGINTIIDLTKSDFIGAIIWGGACAFFIWFAIKIDQEEKDGKK